MRPAAGALVALTLLACDLGIDESQIGAGGANGTSATQVGVTSGPSSSASQTTSTTGSTSAETVSSTAVSTSSSTSVASSTSSGLIPGTVRCFNGEMMQDCPMGQVCCRHAGDETLDHCSPTPCTDEFAQFECDGPDDCMGNQNCCAPAGLNANITCENNCPSEDDVVCEDSGDCEITFDCGSNLSQPYSSSYKTCQF